MKGLEKQEIMWRRRDVYLQIEVELESVPPQKVAVRWVRFSSKEMHLFVSH